MIASCAFIYFDTHRIAFGEENVSGWENFQAWNEENLSWKNIFSNLSNPGKNLYKFIGKNLVVEPEEEAIKVIANIYHLTYQQAEAAVKGSITILLNNTATPERMSTEQALKMQTDILNDYELYKELFDIQQEIDTSVAPTEIFSNGDLQDSGFDLIYDLNVIEKILFDDVTEVTSGKPLTEDEGALKSFMDAIPQTPKAEPKPQEIPVTIKESKTGTPQKAEIKIGDKIVSAEVKEDVCAPADPLSNSLNKFNDQNPPGSKYNPGKPSGSSGGSNPESPNSGQNNSNNPSGKGSVINAVASAEADEWLQGFCGEEADEPTSPPFQSLTGNDDEPIDPNSFGFSVKVALCLKVDLIKTKAISSVSTSCIQCEINKINEYFNKTLGHSLIPNKTTGNIMESALCKKSFSSLLDFKVHLVATPLPAAPADDLLFGKNIIAEWNKFVERFKPYGFDKFAKSETEEFALSYVTPGTTSDELVLAMEQARAQNTAQADNDIKMSTIADDGTNMMLFSTAILSQMNEMKAYFESYKNMFDQIVDTCANIQNKQSIQ